MVSRSHYFPHLVIWFITSVLLYFVFRRHRQERTIVALLAAAEFWITVGLALSPFRVARHVPPVVNLWVNAGFLVIACCVLFGSVLDWLSSRVPAYTPGRRRVLSVAKAAAFAAPALALGAGYLKREELHMVEVDVPIPGLPKDLHGLRIVQISDLHLSPLVSESFVARAVDMANETRAHIAVVTGDLISIAGDPLDACIKQIARLRADAGVFGCMGNHEEYANCKEYTQQQAARVGIPFLRDEARLLRFGNAQLNLAGVDYQSPRNPYLVGAENLIVPGATNFLLSHNPDVFPIAVSKGYDLTISGHTHGGQINIEILHENVNLARFFTPYIYGLYRKGRSTVFVTRGIGTIGLPSRLGAPPEVALLRLCAI